MKYDASKRKIVPRINGFQGPLPSQKFAGFVAEYIKDFNVAASARRAGYGADWAMNKAKSAMKKFELYVNYMIQVSSVEKSRVAAISAQQVLDEMVKIGMANIQDYIVVDEAKVGDLVVKTTRFKPIHELTRSQAAAVKSVNLGSDGSVTYELYDKSSELMNIGRHLGMFNEKVILEHRHRHLHAHMELTNVPLNVLEEMETRLLEYIPKNVIEAS